jgi:hypothetical protein
MQDDDDLIRTTISFLDLSSSFHSTLHQRAMQWLFYMHSRKARSNVAFDIE